MSSSPESPQSDTKVIFHLVHGTFDTEAKWCQEGSPFRTEIGARIPGAEFKAFDWNGHNTHRDRWSAGQEFKKHLLASVKSDPNAKHVIIGHSHGGMVSVYALKNAELPSNVSLVTLGTPFIEFTPRNYSTPLTLFLWLMSFQVLLVMLMLCMGMAERSYATGFESSLWTLPAVGVFAAILLQEKRLDRKLSATQKDACEKFGILAPLRVRTLCMTAEADEALFGIKVSLFGPALVATVRKWKFRILTVCTVISMVLLYGNPFFENHWIYYKLWLYLAVCMGTIVITMPYLILLYAALPRATAKSIFLFGLAGWENPFLSYSCVVNATYQPNWVQAEYCHRAPCDFPRSDALEGKSRYRHCSFMYCRSAIAKIADWVKGSWKAGPAKPQEKEENQVPAGAL